MSDPTEQEANPSASEYQSDPPATDSAEGLPGASPSATEGASDQPNASSERIEMPIFPLGTVLFEGGQLPLRIFEPRYVDMISRCMKSDSGFGVVLIRAGSEVRAGNDEHGPDVFKIGTEARIEDFNPLSDGTLGIAARGARKFRLHDSYTQADGLLIGNVQILPAEPAMGVDEPFETLVEILKELIRHPMIEKMDLEFDFEDARSVGWRLAELLPIEAEIKQSLLQMHLPRERLVELIRIVNKLKG